MTIIQIASRADGFHQLQSQSHRRAVWLPGYMEVPAHLEAAAWDSCGFCELDIQDGQLVSILPTERPPEPAPVMTAEEAALDMMADLDYRIGLLEIKEMMI